MTKLLFFDIDGTLLSHRGFYIPHSTKKALAMTKAKGNILFLATGRQLGSLGSVSGLPMDGVVFCNGAGVRYQGEIIDRHVIPHEIVSKTVFQAEERNGSYTLFNDYASFRNLAAENDIIRMARVQNLPMSFAKMAKEFAGHPFTDYRNEDILKMDISFPSEDIMNDFLKSMDPSLFLASTAGYNVSMGKRSGEVTLKGVNKGEAVKRVAELLHVPIEDTYAFGDSMNDYEMIQMAGTGIAMGNAFPEVKEVADYVTTSVDHDGIYNAMEHLALI